MDSFLALNSLISNTDPNEKIVENTIELSDSYVDLISNSTVLSKEEISNILSKIDKRLINQEMVQQLARKSTDIESAKRLLKTEINRMKEKEDNSDYNR